MASTRITEADYAVVIYREDGEWQSGLLPERLINDLDGLLSALRQQPGEGGSIGFVNVGDDFFVALRVVGDGARMLLSDVTASVAWDLAKQIVDRLGIEPPSTESEVEEVWPAGDMSIFADLGLDEMQLGAILSDLDAYADDMLFSIADRLGFADAYERAVNATMR